MKLDVTRTLADQVYICGIATSKFSEADQELMHDFGTPDIDLGGDFGGNAAGALGNVDLSAGHDWSSVNQTLKATVNGGAETTVTLDADCDDLGTVVEHINSALALENLDANVEAYASTNYVGIRTVHKGADQELILAAGSPDALATLGVLAGTYTGGGAEDYTLPARLRPVSTLDTPMVQRFDARDERFAGSAELSADLWITTIVALIKAAMDTLRAESDTFSGETTETY